MVELSHKTDRPLQPSEWMPDMDWLGCRLRYLMDKHYDALLDSDAMLVIDDPFRFERQALWNMTIIKNETININHSIKRVKGLFGNG